MTQRKTAPRVSMFDIFIGSGRTIRRPQGPPGLPFLQTNNATRGKTTDEKVNTGNTKNAPSKQGKLNGGNGGNSNNNAKEGKADKKKAAEEARTFTDAQDAQLIDLEGEGKTWPDIAAEMDKPEWALKQRLTTLKSGEDGEGKGKTGKQQNNQNKTNNGKIEEGKQGGGGKGKGKGKGKVGEQDTKFSLGEWITISEDDTFSFRELQALGEIISEDTDMRWERVASSFFDRTGKRFHPMDIKDKFAAMDGV